ncbi:hypothetical protein [Pedobacter sp. Leaf176]|uniref:hypothetical protein n=1 Tax=Pedobacter sp. Leaf176 TaxID=1736286 RepID=UPI000AD4ED1E|nr:hypothetical protein [Pedobacter sp. Leaf176]
MKSINLLSVFTSSEGLADDQKKSFAAAGIISKRDQCVINFLGMLLFTLVYSGCVTFEKNLINPYPLNAANVKKLNGVYDIKERKPDSVTQKYWMYNNFLTEIDRKLMADTFKLDSFKRYKFELLVLDGSHLQINYIENEQIIKERILNTSLRKDGYMYLKNKNLGFLLVPYLAGGIDIKKTRLTISPDGDLIFDVVHHRSAAIFFIMFLDGRTWHYRNEYKKY